MKYEKKSNLRLVHRDCAKKEKGKTQSSLSKSKLSGLVGKHIKKSFTDGKCVEHMWVKITGCNETAGTLIGELANEPFTIKNIRLGDEVIVEMNEIEQVM